VAPPWLEVLAWLSLATALACAGAIVFDIVVRAHRQRMWIMDLVWPTTALYAGPLGWWGYRRYGRLISPAYQAEARVEPHYREAVSTAIGAATARRGARSGTSSASG
jgi:hypothetical protein